MFPIFAVVFILAAVLLYNKTILEKSRAEVLDRPFVPSADKIKVIKSIRKLIVQRDGQIVRQYDIDLGASPVGRKEREGDGKTPEGGYVISGRNPKSRYFLSLRISYPNGEDRRKAETAGVSPGGDIMIHGLKNSLFLIGFRKPLKKDWTQGCIAVSNKDMAEIWSFTADGTPVEILP